MAETDHGRGAGRAQAPATPPAAVGPAAGARIPALDGLRGLAILMVFLFHFGEDRARDGVITKLLFKATDFGWTGVDLFFALSGFLITGILLDSKGKPAAYSKFVVRRVLRIFPPYYALLLLLFVVLRAPLWSSADFRAFYADRAWYWLYLQNWRIASGVWPLFLNMGHLWSLAIEEQFYLVWPSVVLLCGRRTTAWVAGALVVLAPLLRVAAWGLLDGDRGSAVYVSTVTRMDVLAFGALVAILVRSRRGLEWLGRSSPGLALGAAVVVLGVLAARRTFRWPDPGVQIVGLSAVGVLAAMAVAWAATDGPGRWIVRVLGVRPLRWLGQVSYVAYLIHQPILQINIGLEGKATWLGTWTAGRTFVASAGLTLIGAWLSWVVLEKPILRLRLRLEAAAGRVKPTLW